MFFGKLVAALTVTLSLSSGAWAQPVLPDTVRNAPSEGRYKDYDFTQDIAKARLLLMPEKAGVVSKMEKVLKLLPNKKNKKKKSWQSVTELVYHYNYVLAIKRHDRRAIEVLHVNDEGTNSRGFVVTVGEPSLRPVLIRNGVNTRITVEKPQGYVVLAIKRAIRTTAGFEEVLYTPYSPDMDTPKMRQLGWNYIHSILDAAYVRAKTIRSRAKKDETAAEVVPRNVTLALVLIEHIDMLRLEDTPYWKAVSITVMLNRLLVTFGANLDDTYNYSVSSADARGPFQIIPTTYRGIRRLYPDAKLHPNFAHGMMNHVNAGVASILVSDDNFAQIPPDQLKFMRGSVRHASAFQAAAYNGGTRVVRAVRKHKAWGRYLKKETQDYLIKLSQLEDLLKL